VANLYLRYGAGRHKWEQEKLEGRKMLENAAEFHFSAACCVGWHRKNNEKFAIFLR
jgi:hypothetical protein